MTSLEPIANTSKITGKYLFFPLESLLHNPHCKGFGTADLALHSAGLNLY